MTYLNVVVNKMEAKYGLLTDKPIQELPEILNEQDWNELAHAMKYPNGRVVAVDTYAYETHCECGKRLEDCDESYAHITSGA